VTMAQR